MQGSAGELRRWDAYLDGVHIGTVMAVDEVQAQAMVIAEANLTFDRARRSLTVRPHEERR